MKTQILKFLLVALTLSMCFIACNKPSGLMEEDLNLTPTMDDTNLQMEEEYPSTLIATIQKEGHQIKFYTTGSSEDPGIFMEESLYGRALQTQEEYLLAKDKEGSNPFEVFVALTDSEISVPKAIANSAKDDLLELSGRKVKETTIALELLDAYYSEDANNLFRGCSGDIGYTNFRNWYCRGSHSWNINHCGASERSSMLRRYSYFQGQWQEHQNTRVRVNNTCGSVTLYYYSWTSNGWRLDRSKTLNPGNNYHSHWISNKTELRLVIVPGQNARYRSLVNFVK